MFAINQIKLDQWLNQISWNMVANYKYDKYVEIFSWKRGFNRVNFTFWLTIILYVERTNHSYRQELAYACLTNFKFDFLQRKASYKKIIFQNFLLNFYLLSSST